MTSEEEIVKLRTALAEAAAEIDALKARLDGDIPRTRRCAGASTRRLRRSRNLQSNCPARPGLSRSWPTRSWGLLGRAAASKAARSGFESRQGHS